MFSPKVLAMSKMGPKSVEPSSSAVVSMAQKT